MLFNSYTFLFLFLPMVLGGFLFLSNKNQRSLSMYWLVLASLVFYGYFKWEYLIIIVVSILFNYYVGKLLRSKHSSNMLLFFGILSNISLLIYYKYAGLLSYTAIQLGAEINVVQVLLPIGISFFTFQQIAYLVDSSKGDGEGNNFIEYCLFVTFFPQLIAGPIVHHRDMIPQFLNSKKNHTVENLCIGSSIFIVGLFKKVVLADSIALHASPVFFAADSGGSISFIDAWVGLLAYTMQLYFDFSGYSDMAIGLGRMFGIILPLNFNSPYKAKSIAEFWRRWHMTLSKFLKDYVYIPLGGNRFGEFRRYTNLFITMLIGGIWHGAGWNFFIWGGVHGLMLVIHQLFSRAFKGFKIPVIICWGITFICVTLAWIPFRAQSFDGSIEMLKGVLGLNGFKIDADIVSVISLPWVIGLMFIALFLPNTQSFFGKFNPALGVFKETITNKKLGKFLVWNPNVVGFFVIVIALVVTFNNLSAQTEFIYFQF